MRTIKELKDCLEEYEEIVKYNSCTIQDTIITAGRLTLNKFGQAENKQFPDQFTKSKAEEVALEFLTKNPFIEVHEVNYIEWYKQKIENIKSFLNTLDKR